MNWPICHQRKLLFLFVFSTYLLVVLLKFQARELVGCGIYSLDVQLNSPSNEYPPEILCMDPSTLKQEIPKNTWWWCHHHGFSGISCFWGSGVRQKYAVWVLVGCGIKFHIEQALPIEIWVKTQWDVENTNKKSSFF